MSRLAQEVLEAIRSAVGEPPQPLHEPRVDGNEQQYVADCIRSTYVSSVGAYVDRFEHTLAEAVGVKRAVAVVNGTAALQVSLQLAGVQRGDEVLVPGLTFVATANAVHFAGAVPHFIDCAEDTLGANPKALRQWLQEIAVADGAVVRNRRTGRVIRAVIPMHTFGHICDMQGILAVANEFHLAVVEDAAESLGSARGLNAAGSYGLIAALSFNGNKVVTTGGGGAIVTDDDELADIAKRITTTAKRPHPWEFVHDEIGYNFRMPNLNAALGCAQLERLSSFVDSKRRLADRYASVFDGMSQLRFVREPAGCTSNYWLQTILLDDAVTGERDAILDLTNRHGYGTRPAWTPMHSLVPYRNCPRAPLPVVESLAARIINIPSSAGLA